MLLKQQATSPTQQSQIWFGNLFHFSRLSNAARVSRVSPASGPFVFCRAKTNVYVQVRPTNEYKVWT